MAGLRIFSPVRANLLGGWTDQEDWPEVAAVSNVAIGWSGCWRGQYPLLMDRDGNLHSKVKGHGSGLGISSIWLALQEIHKDPSLLKEDLISVILTVLEREREISKGGWQDQVGGIVPGLKITVTNDHNEFHIRSKPFHPALEHMVLFDTETRRPSIGIGDRIRDLITERNEAFYDHMRWIAFEAIRTFDQNEAEPLIQATLESWAKFVEFVSEMDIPIQLPKLSKSLAYGSYLTGAGGGGFGITWAVNPGYRHRIVEIYRKNDIWAEIPIVINSGPLIVES